VVVVCAFLLLIWQYEGHLACKKAARVAPKDSVWRKCPNLLWLH